MICINSITICPENITITKGKWYYGAYAEICPTNATCKCLTWHSSNSNIASVNENGYICGVSEGAAVIYATAQDGSGAVGFCNVTVAAPIMVSSITVNPAVKTANVGDTFGLSATVCPNDAEDKRIRWTSCDCNIAEVDYLTGCVTAKKSGTTCICANAIDGSGVSGCCEVTCNIPCGTDSIGVYQTLSMLSATPADAETGAPVMLGVQFTEPQNGNYSIRFVSQIKTRNYKSVGYEIHSKFGDADSVADILCSKVLYSSLLADGERVYPDDEFDYFVVCVVENIPENTVASFRIVPFAITLEGKFLHGSTKLISCREAQPINSVDFEIPEHLSASSHIGHAELSSDKNNYTFTCAFSQCDVSFTAPKDQFIGAYVTSDTNPHLGSSQTPLAYGIDVSSHQGEISQEQWNEIANTQIDGHPITFVILRIGRELNKINGAINRQKDECFESNYVKAKAAGLQVGCYYYTESWSPENAVADAEQVIEWIGDKQFEYPIFFDIESTLIRDNVSDNATRTEICTAFMNKMREAGFFTGLYANNDWINTYLDSGTLLPEYDFWYARYDPDDPTPNSWGKENGESDWAGPGRKFGMWQYTDKKYIPPITVKEVDRNVAYKNYPLIIKSLHLNNFK